MRLTPHTTDEVQIHAESATQIFGPHMRWDRLSWVETYFTSNLMLLTTQIFMLIKNIPHMPRFPRLERFDEGYFYFVTGI